MNKKENMTVRQVAESWKAEKRKYVKRSTMAAYTLSLHKHIMPEFGELGGIVEDDVQEFVLAKLRDGFSHNTVRDMVALLRMIQRHGEKCGWPACGKWNIKYPTGHEPTVVPVLAKADQRALTAHLENDPSPLNIGILVCLYAGLRIGEVCGLKWGDFNIRRKSLFVRRTVERIYIVDCDTPHTELTVGPPKTKNSQREIPIGDGLMNLLKPMSEKAEADHYVLTNGTKPTEPRSYRNHFARMLKRLGISPIRFHGLRHSFATRCIESQCDCKTVSSLLGHADVSTTLNLYVHPDYDQKLSCIERMLKHTL